MNSEFYTFFQLGIQHIADIKAYDHILFIVALCAIYTPSDWRKVLVLVTAFTIGDSLTLGLSALNILVFPSKIIEFLIPVTILITAILNLTVARPGLKMTWWKYVLPMFFGFIHGSGFSNYFKSLLGKEENIIKPLFSFNVGIEVGQIGIVLSLMTLTWVVLRIVKNGFPIWSKLLSILAGLVALYLMYETKFW